MRTIFRRMVVIVATIRFRVDDFFSGVWWRRFVFGSTFFAGRELFSSRRFVFKSTIFAGEGATIPVAAKRGGVVFCERVWLSRCHTPTSPPRAFRVGSIMASASERSLVGDLAEELTDALVTAGLVGTDETER